MPNRDVGILGYGVYMPRYRIRTDVIVRARERKRKDLQQFLDKVQHGLLLRSKTVADVSEDSTTMAAEAALNAIEMADIDPSQIETVAAGSESKPYAVGTIARHVASFLGVGNNVYIADLEGACNAGMQSTAFVESQIMSGRIQYGLSIGTDVAQAPIGDPLEFACGSGASAFLLGSDKPLATIRDIAAYSSLTLDFWRREGAQVPSHFGKTTVEAYVKHVVGAIEALLVRRPEISMQDFDYVTFHQPSGYMPLKTCKLLTQDRIDVLEHPELEDRISMSPEFIEERVRPWFRVVDIGNTYSASTMIATCDILDHARAGEDILAVSYGSGAYTLATWLHVENEITERRGKVPTVRDYINRGQEVKFEFYERVMNYKQGSVRSRLRIPRIIAEVEPFDGQMMNVTLCNGCERVFYPSREKCLQSDCEGPVEQRSLPSTTRLLSAKRLTLKQKLISNFQILKQGKALLVDATIQELTPGMELESVIRRIDDEGKQGLIIYCPAYRPIFRSKTRSTEDRSEEVVVPSRAKRATMRNWS